MDGLFAAGGLVEQGDDRHGARALGHEVGLQEGEGIAGVENILDDDDVAVGDVALQVAGDLHDAGGLRPVLIGGQTDELQLALQLRRAHEVGHKDEAAVQNADEQGILPGEAVIELVYF